MASLETTMNVNVRLRSDCVFEPTFNHRPLDLVTAAKIGVILSPIEEVVTEWGGLDRTRGYAWTGPRSICWWTESGRRVTLSLGDGSSRHTVRISLIPDPPCSSIDVEV